jgi:CRISPR/Cas system-associated exonuclease Cas4 (RecB family)
MPPGTLLIVLAVAAAAAGTLGLAVLSWYRRKTGFRATWSTARTRLIASDTGAARSLLLRDPELGLRGRPDYLLEVSSAVGRLVVPLELKPRRRSRRLYESDGLQLGAYLMLTRATFGERAASFGYVRYAEADFRVELTGTLERRLREVVAAIRSGRETAVIHRSHGVAARCAGCAVRQFCDEALV